MANNSAIVVFATTSRCETSWLCGPHSHRPTISSGTIMIRSRAKKVAKSIIHSGDAGVALIQAKRTWFSCSITVTSSCGANSR